MRSRLCIVYWAFVIARAIRELVKSKHALGEAQILTWIRLVAHIATLDTLLCNHHIADVCVVRVTQGVVVNCHVWIPSIVAWLEVVLSDLLADVAHCHATHCKWGSVVANSFLECLPLTSWSQSVGERLLMLCCGHICGRSAHDSQPVQLLLLAAEETAILLAKGVPIEGVLRGSCHWIKRLHSLSGKLGVEGGSLRLEHLVLWWLQQKRRAYGGGGEAPLEHCSQIVHLLHGRGFGIKITKSAHVE